MCTGGSCHPVQRGIGIGDAGHDRVGINSHTDTGRAEFLHRLHAEFGPQRLMWATDWPIVENAKATYAQALTLVRDDMPFLNADDKSWMLSKTIERVWPF